MYPRMHDRYTLYIGSKLQKPLYALLLLPAAGASRKLALQQRI